jgi:basic membrane protein A and related proteins
MMTLSRRRFTRLLGGALVVPATASLLSTRSLAAGVEASVALLLPGSVADGGWNMLAYRGLEVLKKEGYKVAHSESIPQAQMEQVARGYANAGYKLIIGHGFEFGSAFLEIGPDFPDTDFFASTFKPSDKVPKNVEYVDLDYVEAAYGAGAFAALISDKGKAVGFVGGGDNPTQQGMMRAFIKGAEATRPGLKGLGIVTGDYNDAAKGREAATTMIGNGADVIWHAADVTGLGAIQGAVAAKVKVIGCYADQSAMAPHYMATSFMMNLPFVVEHVAASVTDGKFLGGQEWKPVIDQAWLVVYGKQHYNPSQVTAAEWAKFETVWAELAANKIDVKQLIKA